MTHFTTTESTKSSISKPYFPAYDNGWPISAAYKWYHMYAPRESYATPETEFGYTPTQNQFPGTYQYQPIDQQQFRNLSEAASKKAFEIPTSHVRNSSWGDKYARTSQWWKYNVGSAMGLGGAEATDPLARLQNQLMEQYTGKFFQPKDKSFFEEIQKSRNQAIMDALQQREAQMGTKNLYGGVRNELDQVRETLVNQAMNEYDPLRFQAKQQADLQTNQLLQAINEAKLTGEGIFDKTGTLPY